MASGPEPFINENIWVTLSFIVFVILVWKKAGGALSSLLDRRSAEIKHNLEDAKRLRDEAQAELHKYQRLQREATDKAREIMANAEQAALSIERNASKAAEATINRRTEQAEAKIKTLESEAIAEIRAHAAMLATSAAIRLMEEKLDAKAASKLITADIAEIKHVNQN